MYSNLNNVYDENVELKSVSKLIKDSELDQCCGCSWNPD